LRGQTNIEKLNLEPFSIELEPIPNVLVWALSFLRFGAYNGVWRIQENEMSMVTEVHLTNEKVFTFVGDYGFQVSSEHLTMGEFGDTNKHHFPRMFVERVEVFDSLDDPDVLDESETRPEPALVLNLGKE